MAEKKGSNKSKRKQINTLPFYVVLIVAFLLFIYYQANKSLSTILGIALFLMIVVIIALELINGVNEEGATKNLIEIGIAVVVVVVFWFGLKALLHTNYPLDVVPSCSMLPQLKRGDLIALQGVSKISMIKAPIIKVSQASINNLLSNTQNDTQNQFLSCVSYHIQNNRIQVSQIVKPNYSIGLYRSTSDGAQIIPSQAQSGNLVQFTCGEKTIQYTNGTTAQEAYTTAVAINGTTIYNDTNNTVVVYATVPQDLFYQLGDSYIVHRIYAVLNASGNYYFLTKGDNNPGLDLQYGNYPFNMSNIEGRVIYSIPYLGYFKLVLSNSFSEPAGCNSTVINN